MTITEVTALVVAITACLAALHTVLLDLRARVGGAPPGGAADVPRSLPAAGPATPARAAEPVRGGSHALPTVPADRRDERS